jgi:amino acid adenylation domain-containing protein/non-ribosomal peptide synthase protein (TIGR01720 family)
VTRDLAAKRAELLRRKLERAGLSTSDTRSERIPPRPAGKEIPLSFAQQRMWLLQQWDPDSPAYNVCISIRLRGPLDHGALRSALRALVARHEVLRTRYVSTSEGVPTQVVDERSPFDLTVVDLRGQDDQNRRAREVALADSAKPFDLATDHSIRATLVLFGPEDQALVLTVHHIAWDGGTFTAFSRELSELYRAEIETTPGPVPLPVQYADFAVWHRAKWTDERLAGDLDYWRSALTPEPDPVPLPTDGPRGATPSDRGSRRRRTFSAEVTQAVTDYAKRTAATPFMVLFAGFAALSHRYTGATDIPFGTATMSRDHADLPDLIGNFGNTLVLRADLAGDPSFAELTERAKRICADGFAHQDVPFDKLVEHLKPRRERGHSVFFDVMLLFLTQGLQGPRFPGVSTEWETVHNNTAQFDLALETFMVDGRLRIEATHRLKLFTEDTVDRMLAHFETLLGAALSDPDLPVSRIDVLSPEHRAEILTRWNDTATPMPSTTLLDLVETQVAGTPNRIAVEYGAAALTYAELNGMANRLARKLVAAGVGPERTVGVHLERSIEMVVGLLAALKAGGAFVPLEPSWPRKRVEEVCANAGFAAILAERSDVLTGTGVPVLAVDLAELAHGTGDPNLDVPLVPENLAYVIYTSGSTGVPKGAMIRHHAIAHRLIWQRGLLGFGTDDAALFKAPLGFDISINEVFLPLVTGGRLVIAEPGGQRDVEYLVDTIARHRVTFVYLVSSMLDLMLGLDDIGDRAGSLRHVWCGGEMLTPDLFTRFRERLDAVMYHGYGPAEATIGVSHVVYRTGTMRSGISIGRPNSNTRLYVLDRALQPVPVGVPGELYAAGVYLGRGYLNDPARTAAAFVADPFGPPGSRLYRTGDLARWRPDGTLEFLGRADNQVKIRGMRVELEEIEAVLEQHPRIRRAVVLLREDTPGAKRLTGYWTGASGTTSAEVGEWLAARLPEHMVPQAFVSLTEFPFLPSGKVDRARLPAPEVETTTACRPPATEHEKILCGLIADLLGLAGVGVDDNFFTLGGDSIVSVRLVGAARKAGVVITPRQVFEHPTPAELAAVATLATTVHSAPETDAGPAVLTPIMHWSATDPGNDPFGGLNQSVLLITPGDLTEDGLVRGLNVLLDRHEMLRARLDRGTLVPSPVDARELVSRAEWDAGRLTAEAAAARDRLDPAAGKLLRAVWFPDAHRLLLVAHHLAVDWVSWSILTADLRDAWESAMDSGVRGGTSFARWTRLLAGEARTPRRAAERDFWARTLDAALLLDEPEPGRDVAASVCVAESRVPPETAAPLLTTLPSAYRAGVHEVLLTGLAAAITDLAGGPVVVGLEGHGRDEELADGIDLSGTVGWFTTYFPVRLDSGDLGLEAVCEGGKEAGELLKRVKEQVRAAPDHGVGYGLLRHLVLDEVLCGLAEPRIAFNYLGRVPAATGRPWDLAPESATFRLPPRDDRPVTVAMDIDVSAVEQDGDWALHIAISWPKALVERGLVDSLLSRWERALHGLAAHAARRDAGGYTPSDLPLVSLTQDDIDELETELDDEPEIGEGR